MSPTNAWRPAKSLTKLKAQLDAAFPHRSTRSDGMIGDQAHAATVSDHNPDADGVVRAADFTNDPANGLSASWLAEVLRASQDDRIKYLISNGRICSSYPAHGYDAWAWRPYSGLNAHTSHLHVSVVDDDVADSTRAWVIEAKTKATTKPKPAKGKPAPGVKAPTFPLPRGFYFGPYSGPYFSISGRVNFLPNGRRGNRHLQAWQARMADRGWKITADGLFGDQTAAVVEAFQAEKALKVDGRIGPRTWAAAWEAPVTR